MASCSSNSSITIWSFPSWTKSYELREHRDAVICLAWSKLFLASGSNDKTVILWEISLNSNKLKNKWVLKHQFSIVSLVYDPE